MRSRTVACVALALVTGAAVAQQIPLSNWTVPPYRSSGASGGYTTMVDISPGVGFVAIQPCRVVDTRGGGGFTGAYGPPAMLANAQRSFDINSAPHCPGIPNGVDAYSLNFTVTQTAGAPGDVRVWPTGNPPPPAQITSVLNWTTGNATLANATIIPAGAGGSIDVYVAGTATHLLIDINGYFSDALGTNQFEVRSGGGVAIFGENTGSGYGVWGVSATGYGVVAGGGAGGVWATTSGAGSGVYGQNTAGGYGVHGETSGSEIGHAGVLGRLFNGSISGFESSAVRGESVFSTGVMGLTRDEVSPTNGSWPSRGVWGIVAHPTLAHIAVASGTLGYNGHPSSGGNYGVYSQGAFGGTGANYVVEPHPQNAGKVIRSVALQGSEAGTYFRGRGKFQNGIAAIEVPEDFRLVTDAESLSVVATPIGPMATVSVASVGLDRIVLQASRNVEFFYLVHGVRKSHNHLTPIGDGREFMPDGPNFEMPLYLTKGQKEMLIQNGTYNPDGTVNMETARRLGWDKVWEKGSKPAPQPTPE